MELSELGEPEREFYVYMEGVGLGESFIWERDSDPGFAKWIVQPAEVVRHDWWEEGFYYCDEAKVHFTGKRIDGTLFASTRKDGLPLTFIIGQDNVMQGFSMAVSSMEEGEKAVFIIPPELALTKFGCPASFPGNIPPNQALRFDIELISLVIVTDILDDEGILKKNIKRGMGNGKPRDLDEVIVSYNACMEDGVSVSMSEGVEFNLAEGFFCPAFAIAVETMTEGEEAVFIVKPEYGFGEQGKPSIGNEATVPPGATLYVYLKLISYTTVNHIGEGHTILIKRTLRRGNSEGQHPENQAVVGVRLIGKLQDGVIFDHRGHEGDEPFKFIVDEEQVSDVLEEAVLTMREGEIASFTIPPQRLQDQLLLVPSGSSVTYEIELVYVVNEKEPRSMSRAESIETAFRKEKEGDNLFCSSKMLRAYRRYLKAHIIIQPYIEIIKRKLDEGTDKQEIYKEPVEEEIDEGPVKEETEEEKIDEETDGEEIHEQLVEEEIDEGTNEEEIDEETDEEDIYICESYEEEIDEEIKEMFVSFSFKAAECATQLQCYELAKGLYDEILRYDPENVKAQQLAGQPFPQDSVGIDTAAMHRGLWKPQPAWAPSGRRLKQGRHKPEKLIDVPLIQRPDGNVPTSDSPATRATSDVNRSRATPSNENQNSGTITPPGRPTILSSDGALHKLNLTEDNSEKGTK
uniref:peptidylprolyl isomerase n=1 Tax=Oryza punctata TaxID=4537 RepID=A0A0E0JK63_ORYPU